MTKAEIATLVLSLISIGVSVAVSILIYLWSKKDTSTDYKIKDEIIKDLLLLEGNLNSICIKSATRHLQPNLTLENEIEFIKTFLVSPTMSFILSYDNSEEDKLFYLDLFLIANNRENIQGSADLAKNASAMLHNICKTNLIDKIKKISSTDCLQLITNNKEQVNWLLKTTNKTVDKSSEKEREFIIKQLKHIKVKGIEDPYIELFLALSSDTLPPEEEIEKIINLCLKEYGRLDITDKQIIKKYEDCLKDFEYEES